MPNLSVARPTFPALVTVHAVPRGPISEAVVPPESVTPDRIVTGLSPLASVTVAAVDVEIVRLIGGSASYIF